MECPLLVLFIQRIIASHVLHIALDLIQIRVCKYLAELRHCFVDRCHQLIVIDIPLDTSNRSVTRAPLIYRIARYTITYTAAIDNRIFENSIMSRMRSVKNDASFLALVVCNAPEVKLMCASSAGTHLASSVMT